MPAPQPFHTLQKEQSSCVTELTGVKLNPANHLPAFGWVGAALALAQRVGQMLLAAVASAELTKSKVYTTYPHCKHLHLTEKCKSNSRAAVQEVTFNFLLQHLCVLYNSEIISEAARKGTESLLLDLFFGLSHFREMNQQRAC